MKKLNSILIALLLVVGANAQTSSKMSYQAVVRGSTGQLVTNNQIGMRVTILQGTSSGTAVYTETATSTSNENGLVSFVIGNGNVVTGNYNTINWSNGPYFIKTETDLTGGTNYTISGTSELLSVPFAKYAETSGNPATPDADASTKGKIALGGDLAGATSTAEAPIISDNAITTSKIADESITAAKISDGNITTVKISDASITGPKIADWSIENNHISDAAVTYAKLQYVSASGKILGRVSPGSGIVEEITTTGTGDAAMSDSPVFIGIPTAPTANVTDNSTQLATTEFAKAAITANEIKETPSGMGMTLSEAQSGKIITTQWAGWPVFPDDLPVGFNCTIINYSNYDFTSNPLSTASFFTPIMGWNNGSGNSVLSIKSGGTVKISVIEINNNKCYFVTGDIL